MLNRCAYGHGMCTAPDTLCPHWIGIVCEFDEALDGELARIEEKRNTYGHVYIVGEKKLNTGNVGVADANRIAEAIKNTDKYIRR